MHDERNDVNRRLKWKSQRNSGKSCNSTSSSLSVRLVDDAYRRPLSSAFTQRTACRKLE